jgi:tRNA-Thr(GGU) m(6)t(6)A37 methyltransferase TsaA
MPIDEPAKRRQTVECVVIGSIHTPYKRLEDCPRTAHDNPEICTLALDPAYADGLFGMEQESHVLVLYWLDKARRDWLRRPARPDRKEVGVFALRTPNRPNPVAAIVVPIVQVRDSEVDVRGLDCLDGTPLLDIKRAIFFDGGDGRSAV